MSSVRFSNIDLKYGCHDRSIKLPIKKSPVVIAAPNGCGKTTLVEALVRAVFGFDQSHPDDRQILEYRRPWDGSEMQLAVELVDDDWAVWKVERDLASSRLTITSPAGESRSCHPGQEGSTGNPGSPDASEELVDLFGFDDRDLYESTSCLQQGELLIADLRDELLQVAATTHSRADAARLNLAASAQSWKVGHPCGDEEPVKERHSIGELEERIADLEASLAESSGIESRRQTLNERADGLRLDLDKIDEEIESLNEERDAILGRCDEKIEIERARERLLELEGVEADLERALANLDPLEKEGTPTARSTHEYPSDFKSRAARIEELWEERKNQRKAISKKREYLEGSTAPSPALIVVAILLALAGLPTWLAAGMGMVGLALSAVGFTFLVVLLVRRKSTAAERTRLQEAIETHEGELNDIKGELATLVADIPDGEDLRRERLAELVREFEDQNGVGTTLDDATEDLEEVASMAREILEKRSGNSTPSRPEQVLVRVQKEIAAATIELDELEENGSPTDLSSPGGQPSPSLESLETSLAERRLDRDGVFDELTAAQRAIVEEGRLSRSPLATKQELDKLRSELEEVRDRQAALQLASELIDDAYDEYREQDDQRLVDAISHALVDITSGELGPLTVEDHFDKATVKVDQRELPLACPPLGYGEYHAAQLAIRLGGAGFLSNLGVRAPLIIDEPFAHLDESRSVQLWRILNRIARDRQVIVATHNHLLLDQVGVTPDVVLDQPPAQPMFAGAA